MKSAPLPALDLDAATALALPLADVKARAQFRFRFDLPDGQATWLLSRLCEISWSHANQQFRYCVVLRPESAETERVFVTENLRYRDGQRELIDRMTREVAAKWDWELFAQLFNDSRCGCALKRFWKTDEQGETILLNFRNHNWGAICDSRSYRDVESFIWRHKERGVSDEADYLQFLRVRDEDFRRDARALWEQAEGPIQTALRWSKLSEEEKSATAFECERGSWAQLREVASWVLTIYASGAQNDKNNHEWDFTSHRYIAVNGLVLEGGDEQIFLLWRAALTQSFGTHNVGAEGVKMDSLPLCLWSYINHNELSHVEIAPPSMHEAMEAQLKLRDWAGQHFAPDEAARLLGLLT